jgi:hypothetical protein
LYWLPVRERGVVENHTRIASHAPRRTEARARLRRQLLRGRGRWPCLRSTPRYHSSPVAAVDPGVERWSAFSSSATRAATCPADRGGDGAVGAGGELAALAEC